MLLSLSDVHRVDGLAGRYMLLAIYIFSIVRVMVFNGEEVSQWFIIEILSFE